MPSAGQVVTAAKTPRSAARATVTTDSASITTTETAIVSVTAALVSGETYRITFQGRIDTSVNGDDAFLRIREDSTTGTQLMGDIFDIPDQTLAHLKVMIGFYTAVSTGNKTFVATLIRNAGTGNLILSASASVPGTLEVVLTGS